MYASLTFLTISLFTLAHTKVLDEDMLLYWRRSDSANCKPFTTYLMGCNKCVCSADGTAFCTRMACFRSPRFLTDNLFSNMDQQVEMDAVYTDLRKAFYKMNRKTRPLIDRTRTPTRTPH